MNPFRKYVVEFLGTFFLVMTICMVSGFESGWSYLGIGSMLVVMTYLGGHISGSHFNPAISVAIWLRGKMDGGDVLPYIVAQLLGATLAAMLAGFLLTAVEGSERFEHELMIGPALIAELLGTILLVLAYLTMFVNRKSSGNSYFGLVIGFTYMAVFYAFGNVSVGAFNPAVALGITMAEITSWSSIWIFAVGNFVGGVLAAFLGQYLNGPDQ